jgi:hypothetical protein
VLVQLHSWQDTHCNKDVGAFVRGPLEEFREKAHRIWRVGQRGETSVSEASKEKADDDVDRFLHIVMFDLALRAIWFGDKAIDLREDDDDVRRLLDVWFMPVRVTQSAGEPYNSNMYTVLFSTGIDMKTVLCVIFRY